MLDSTLSAILVTALLALFLVSITVAKYAILNTFQRTRFMMSALFLFIVSTLSIAFWPFALITLPFTIPALVLGMALGYFIGVHTERQKIVVHGIEHYIEHFAHIKDTDFKKMSWWSVINFYSITCALILINLVGFTSVIMHDSPVFVVVTSTVGATLIGSIIPYLAHLWTFRLQNGMATRAPEPHTGEGV